MRKMKKRLLAVALCMCTAFLSVACGGGEDNGNKETKTEAKYELGEYKGIKVDASLSSVPQEDIDKYLEQFLQYNAKEEEIKEGTLAKGDVIKVTYKSTVDGKEYKNSVGYKVTLSDKGFAVDGFVDGLIGKNVGEKVTLNLKLPSDWSEKDYANKDIVFEVTIECIVKTVVPELTDEYVTENFSYLGLKTKDDFVKYITEDVLYIDRIYYEVWEEVLKNFNVISYDSDKLKGVITEYAESFEYDLYVYYQMDLESYFEQYSVSEEEHNKQIEDSAKAYLKQEMLIDAIAEAEGITITEEMYQKEMLEMAGAYGYKTVAEFEEAYKDSMTREDFEYSILSYLVEEFVCKNVVFVEGFGLRNEEESSSGNTETGTVSEATTGEAATEETTTAAN